MTERTRSPISTGPRSTSLRLPPPVRARAADRTGVVRAVAAFALRHPAVFVAAVAALPRLLFVLVVGTRPGYVVPDAEMYVALAQKVAEGRLPDVDFYYWQTNLLFLAPVSWAFRIFGAHESVAALVAVVFGVVTACVVTVFALRLLPRAAAVVTGLLVALWPSQVLWSSTAIRESMIWALLAACVAAMAYVVADERRGRQLVAVAVFAGSLLALGYVREQTMILAGWAGVLAVAFAAVRGPRAVHGLVLVASLLVPVVPGYGLGGWDFIRTHGQATEDVRATMARGADSAIVAPDQPADGPAPATGAGPAAPDASAGAGEPGAESDASGETLSTPGAGLVANAKHLPAGLVAVSVRPFVWERSTSGSARVAAFENVIWMMLYALSVVGVWALGRQRVLIAYPVLLTGAILGVAALTQGNLGTAFRHRAQVLCLLAPLAVAGTWHLRSRLRPVD